MRPMRPVEILIWLVSSNECTNQIINLSAWPDTDDELQTDFCCIFAYFLLVQQYTCNVRKTLILDSFYSEFDVVRSRKWEDSECSAARVHPRYIGILNFKYGSSI